MMESIKQPYIVKNVIHSQLDQKHYQDLYAQSIHDPEKFWAFQANEYLTWYKTWDQILTGDFEHMNHQWFVGAMLNVTYNCLDRHLSERANKVALIWESDDGSESKQYTYQQLFHEVCQFANVLTSLGIQKGDCVCIYLPMIVESFVAMLACARIGAVHSVVFAGFSSEALKTRILDAQCCMVITANESVRANKSILLKQQVDQALIDCPDVKNVIVVRRTNKLVEWNEARDSWYHEMMQGVDNICAPEVMNANDPLFILYTSGSTGKPKGILHSSGGYLLYVAMTFKLIFDYQEEDIFWCTADIGWITGHSYGVYGPLANGATVVIYEGVPNYPTYARYWEIVDKYQVTIFYTAPTAIRALRREGDEWVKQTKRTSLRLLGTVGEPINPEAWEWYYQVVGEERCPIVDTWWQTETGGIALSPIPGVTPLKPGAASWPFFGIMPKIVDDTGHELADRQMGNLVITQPWPGMMLSVYKNHQRFVDTYFNPIPGYYFTGDQAYCDQDGFFWVTGRCDDVLKIAGHRIGTAEVESAFLEHHSVSEAAVVAVADEIKGQAIYAFIVLKVDEKSSDNLKDELVQVVRKELGPIATPKYIQWVDALPKTRSGKIMRRVLRKIANNDVDSLGDLTTLADATIIENIINNRIN